MRLVIRPLRPSDRRFVAATWAQAWRRPVEAGLISVAAWRQAAFRTVEELLGVAGVAVTVVVDRDSASGDADLFGYLALQHVAGEPMPLILFCYVKRDYRRNGLARALLREAGLDLAMPLPCVCWTRDATELREAGKLPNAQWRPDLGRRINPDRSDPHDDRE